MKYLKREGIQEKRVRLDSRLIRKIEELAFREGVSFNFILNKILEEFLNKSSNDVSISYEESPNLVFNYKNRIQIYHNDFLKVNLQELKGKVNLIITSPPYNVGIEYGSFDDNREYEDYLKFTKAWLSKAFDLLADDGRMCLNVPLDKNKNGLRPVYADIVKIAQEVGFKYQSTIIWNEQNISRRTAWGSWLSASAPYVIAPVETIILLYKKSWKRLNKGKSTITREEFIEWTNGLWSFNGENRKRIGHPAPFPVELPKRCIKLFSYENDLVLDPFLGSGTTLIAAYQENRIGIGIEIEKSYVDLAIERLKKVINQKFLFSD